MPNDPTQPANAPLDFRQLIGCFATGVTVATAVDDAGEPVGMTASAVSSVSLDPPLLLVCVSKDARFHGALNRHCGFALNVLAADQAALSNYFAERLDDAFRDVPHVEDPSGPALLDGVVAHIVCEPFAAFEAGDHTVFVGRVVRGATFDRKPLLHHRGRYTTTADPA